MNVNRTIPACGPNYLAVVLLAFSSVSCSQTEPPAVSKPVARKDVENPRSQQNVVIVGAGISGLCAALELGQSGVEVTVIDMSSVFGGHAVMSQGGISIVATPAQKLAGFEDSPNLAYNDFVTWGEDADPEWVRYYVDNSRKEIYDWLLELGVRFSGVLPAPGNSVDRFHQPEGRGIGLVTPIYQKCLELENVKFVWNRKAEQLIVEDGRVAGIKTRNMRDDTAETYRAGATILATGGFQSNLEMVREYWPAEFKFPDRILAGSGVNSMGSGHKLAEAAGAELVKMDHQWNYFTGIPDPRQPNSNRGLSAANMYGIIVNSEGQRFANLHTWAKGVMPALLKQEQATLWFVFDESSKPKFVVSGTDWADFKVVEKLILKNEALVKSADTIEELAQKWGLPPENLANTIQRYNEMVDAGEDKDFGRFGPNATIYIEQASQKIETPPYYAMQAFPLTRKSMGGVAIDLDCKVLDKKKQPIPGLYAVGELTGLAGINGKAALEGTFLGPCVLTARVAAWDILKEINGPVTKSVSAETRCADCHDVESLVAKSRPGYLHFENVHRAVLKRRIDCLRCHAELAPHDEEQHQINQRALATTCVICHVASE